MTTADVGMLVITMTLLPAAAGAARPAAPLEAQANALEAEFKQAEDRMNGELNEMRGELTRVGSDVRDPIVRKGRGLGERARGMQAKATRAAEAILKTRTTPSRQYTPGHITTT